MRSKTCQTKCIAKEILPNRNAMASIVPGDKSKRLGNFYGKEAKSGAQTSPSPTQLYAVIGRRMGMA